MTLRQRIDLLGHSVEPILAKESAKLVKAKAPALTPIQTSCWPFLPLDIDVSPFNNSKTQKEGVSRTYKGCDGYAPIFAYLGAEGYLVNLELRNGSQHCQNGTPGFIAESIRYTHQITSAPVLLRLDSRNDSRDNFPDIERDNVNFIIKRNLRRESPLAWFDLAKRCGEKIPSREGKDVWVGQTLTGINYPFDPEDDTPGPASGPKNQAKPGRSCQRAVIITGPCAAYLSCHGIRYYFYHNFQAGFGVAHNSSKYILSRKESMFCQNP